MISLRKYLEPDVESLQILLRVAQLLTEGIARNAIPFEPAAFERFTTSLLDVAARFTEHTYGSDCLVLAGTAVGALEEYNKQVALAHKSTKQELEGVARSLAQTLASLGRSGSDSVKRLKELESQLVDAKQTSDLRVLRARLDDCLVGIRQEVKQRESESQQVNAQVGPSAKPGAIPVLTQLGDPLTGLPPRVEAEKMLAEIAALGRGFVAVLTMDRLQLYNARYGRTVGDETLRYFAQQFKQAAPADYNVFRWGGPTLLAISKRNVSVEDARLEVKRLQERLPAYELKLETRSVTLALNCRYAVFPAIASLQTAVRKIEVFAAVQGNQLVDKSELADLGE